MRKNHRIAILVDADNAQSHHIKFAVDELEKIGEITIRRAFGRIMSIKGHEPVLTELAFIAEVALPLTNGSKNAADLLMAQFAIRIAERGVVDAIALISSDSDFSAVAHGISETGVRVLGFGKSDASDILKRSYASFTPFPAASINERAVPIAAEPTGLEYRKMKQLIDGHGSADAQGLVRVQTLGAPFKQEFGDDYLRRFGSKNLSTLLGKLDGFQVQGEGVMMTVGRKKPANKV